VHTSKFFRVRSLSNQEHQNNKGSSSSDCQTVIDLCGLGPRGKKSTSLIQKLSKLDQYYYYPIIILISKPNTKLELQTKFAMLYVGNIKETETIRHDVSFIVT